MFIFKISKLANVIAGLVLGLPLLKKKESPND